MKPKHNLPRLDISCLLVGVRLLEEGEQILLEPLGEMELQVADCHLH
jgi:hypothetical protein